MVVIKFIWFLLKNKALLKWYKNFKNRKEYLSLENLSKEVYPKFWIGHSFGWGKTTEGFEYWLRLSQKWRKQLRKETRW